MQNYHKLGSTTGRFTPQTEKAKDTQVANNGGGFGFAITPMQRLERFLILGSTSNTYYQKAQDLTKQNISVIKKLVNTDGINVINKIVEISEAGRASKNDPAIFILALCTASEDIKVRKAAYAALPAVCRIPTHLFTFMEYSKVFRGKGRLYKNAIQNWYLDKSEDQLVYQMLKYRQRNGWTHRDVLRLVKPKNATGIHDTMFAWATNKLTSNHHIPPMLDSFLQVQNSTNSTKVKELILDYGLTREMIPTQFLKSKEIWEALLVKMPFTAMVRNLGNMGACGLLMPFSSTTQKVVEKLHNAKVIENSRIHPIQLLYALTTYTNGEGFKGSNNWTVDMRIVESLQDAFYLSFKNVKTTGKRFLIGLDVSGSMNTAIDGGVLTARDASVAMSVIHAHTEPLTHYIAFSGGVTQLPIGPRTSLREATKMTHELPFQYTDCALPMIYAMKRKIPVDIFIVYTDNDTNSNRSMHPFQALKRYNELMGMHAKLIVCAITSTGFSIADPDSSNMLDIAGFDSAVPSIIADFIEN